MRHPERIEDYLEHITQMIEYATSFVESMDGPESLKKDFKTQAAIVRCIEIIGEAASQIQRHNPDFVKSHSDLPWREMRDMRNKLIHDYFEVDVGAIWQTAKEDLPKLKQQIAGVSLSPKQEKLPEYKPSFDELKARIEQSRQDQDDDIER